jgi:carboxypeptidase Taq
MNSSERFQEYRRQVREIHDLGGALALLGWDQEVTLPRGGVSSRARQRAALATVIHERTVTARLGELIEELAADSLDAFDAADVREMKRIRDRAVRIPSDLVAAKAKAESLAQEAWVQARSDDDWPRFEPHLERLLGLKKREAEAVGYEEEAYDALLDEFEPGARVSKLIPLFAGLRRELTGLLAELRAAAQPPSPDVLRREYDPAVQEVISRKLLQDVGFDFERGRLDTSAHPFTQGLAPGDVRVTSRFDPNDLSMGLYATLHEGGHALYEQGLPREYEGQAVGQAVSLGIHESQSRLWENLVGRSRPFFHYLRPLLAEAFPAQIDGVGEEDLFRAANVVEPGAIRIQADEVTYNLHIILRLELERALLRGELAVADVPGLWREKMRQDLGVTVTNDRDGALQDIHWAFGVFGYFPTYTLGNLYAAQIFERARSELTDLDDQVARGEFAPLLGWLRREIHARGSLLRPGELCQQVSGRPLEITPYLDYLRGKFRAIYGVAT